jgi:hypothetical protein
MRWTGVLASAALLLLSAVTGARACTGELLAMAPAETASVVAQTVTIAPAKTATAVADLSAAKKKHKRSMAAKKEKVEYLRSAAGPEPATKMKKKKRMKRAKRTM